MTEKEKIHRKQKIGSQPAEKKLASEKKPVNWQIFIILSQTKYDLIKSTWIKWSSWKSYLHPIRMGHRPRWWERCHKHTHTLKSLANDLAPIDAYRISVPAFWFDLLSRRNLIIHKINEYALHEISRLINRKLISIVCFFLVIHRFQVN